jgi:hypothetical protein
MKLKFIIPWIAAIGALALAVVIYSGNLRAEAELAQLQERVAGLEDLRNENKRLQAIEAADEELDRLRVENREIFRLRNEVGQLRKERDRPQQAAARPASSPRVPLLPPALPVPPQVQPDPAEPTAGLQAGGADACIANLIVLAEAKAAWAHDSESQPGTAVRIDQILPYLATDVQPACPEGGTYTLNPVNVLPACSIPEHRVVYEEFPE